MVYPNTKVYFDGSHYIGIPQEQKPPQKKRRQNTEMENLLKEEFNKAHSNAKGKRKKEKTDEIKEELRGLFADEESLDSYVASQMERMRTFHSAAISLARMGKFHCATVAVQARFRGTRLRREYPRSAPDKRACRSSSGVTEPDFASQKPLLSEGDVPNQKTTSEEVVF